MYSVFFIKSAHTMPIAMPITYKRIITSAPQCGKNAAVNTA